MRSRIKFDSLAAIDVYRRQSRRNWARSGSPWRCSAINIRFPNIICGGLTTRWQHNRSILDIQMGWSRTERKDGAAHSTADYWRTAEGGKWLLFLIKEKTILYVLYSVGSGKPVRMIFNAGSLEISAQKLSDSQPNSLFYFRWVVLAPNNTEALCMAEVQKQTPKKRLALWSGAPYDAENKVISFNPQH